MKLWFLEVVNIQVKTCFSPCPSALPQAGLWADSVYLINAHHIHPPPCLLHSSVPGPGGPWDQSLRSCVCRTDIQIFTNKLQKMPSLNLYFELSPQNPNLHVVPITTDRVEQAPMKS